MLETIETLPDLHSDRVRSLSLSVGLTRKTYWRMTRFRFQTLRETILGQRLTQRARILKKINLA